MAGPAGGRGSSHGIDCTVLETGMGSAGEVLEAGAPEARRGRQDVRHAALMPSQIQSRAARAEERFRRRRTDDQTAGGAGVGFELCAGCRTAALADGDAAQAPVDARQSALSESTGEPVGTGASQVIELRVGSAGRECAADVEGAGGRGNRPGGSGSSGRLPAARHAGTTARRAGRLYGTQWSLPSDAEDGAGGVAVDGRADRAIGSGGREPTPGASGRGATSGGSARYGSFRFCKSRNSLILPCPEARSPLFERWFIRRHCDAGAHGLSEGDNHVQWFRIHKAKQQSARVRFVVCIGCDGLTLSNYRQNSV